MDPSDSGYLLIADITGYTRFLKDSELKHARGILEQLFAALLDRLRSPFVLSNIQGDAILAHARAEAIADGQQVLDAVEALYCGFADARELMLHNTSCTCSACRNIANLDLKLFVHHGSYAEQSIAGRRELAGPEVILIHRLLKNSITATTGIRAYAAFTQAAVWATALVDYFDNVAHHVERDEQLGDTSLRVLDMRPAWQAHTAQNVVLVDDHAPRWFPDVTVDLPVPPDRSWHYLTDPDLRAAWGVGVVRLTRTGTDRGRVTAGTVDHCAHGDGQVMQFTVLDWRPCEHVTYHLSLPMGGIAPIMIRVSPIPSGSRVLVRAAKPLTPRILQQAVLRFMMRNVGKWAHNFWVQSLANMIEIAKRDAAKGLVVTMVSPPTQQDIRSAVDSCLAEF